MENSNIQNYEKRNDIFLKLQKFHDYFSLKHGQEINNQKNQENTINEEKNIYIKYLDNPEIIFQKNDPNNKNLKLLFKQIENDIKNENNILFPFLNLTSNLVKAYIESDLDNNILQEKIIENINNSYVTKEDSYYLTIIDKIKYNSFIEKDIITYIYEYFSDLYDKVQTIKADNPLIKKFYKMMNLFQIFYEKGKNNNISSICSLGGSFKIFFDEKVSLSQNYTIYVNINILDYYFEDINLKNFSFIEINNYEKKYDSLLKNINNSRLKSISITINFNSIFIEFKTENNTSNPIFENQIVFSEIKEINILEEFYGQISSIEVGIEKNNSKIEYIFQPISIRNENYMYFYEKKIMNKGNELNNIIPKIKVNNLVKVNYLNYNDKNFDIINYFGGVVQFLPFYHIFQAMEGENLNKMNDDIDKMKEVTTPEQNNSFTKTIINSNKKLELYKKYIDTFANFIVKIILEKFGSSRNRIKIFKKYYAFFFYLLLKSNLFLEFPNTKDSEKKTRIEEYMSILIMYYYNQKNSFAYDVKTELNNFISEMTNDNKKIDLKIFKRPLKTFNQLYRHFMKQLFVFNNLWSKKNNFFKNDINDKNLKEIKYKQINYYTKNFQLPFFYPILEITKYYPEFSQLKDGIFFGKDKNVLQYDFNLEETNNNKINKNKEKEEREKEKEKRVNDIFEALIYKEKVNKESYEECCLVKNTHHVKGKLYIIKKIDSKKKKLKLVFQSKKNSEMCNKKAIKSLKENNNQKSENNKQNKKEDKMKSLCYGSSFQCPSKEFNRNIIIKEKDIMFILFRIYYHRVSGLEIFTINKSYYFNFQNYYDINNFKKNKIINEFKINPSFKEIKMKREKIVLGFYNIIYESVLFPLFRDEINVWDKKIKYLCKYDTLILINIFSNRSFRDVYQYPVFPILFDWLNLKRNLGEHVALQNITNESTMRRDLIINIYEGDDDNEINETEKYLFNIHYSNPAFLFNYLLRVLPYSFLAVEFQGDGFDNANRLFFSIEKSLKSTLSLKSDLREMIPELYYMAEIFFNKNKLLFDNLSDGTKIDDVEIRETDYINEKEEDSKVPKTRETTQMQDIAKYLCKMRNSLENSNDLNKWIDLIFGVKQKYYKEDGKKYQYYERTSETVFKNDMKMLSNSFIMSLADFGLLPFQLFNKEFPSEEGKNKKEIIKELKNFNISLFIEEHKKINSPIDTFICKGSTIININYIHKIDPKEQISYLEYFEFPHKYLQKFDINKFDEIYRNPFNYMDIENKNSETNAVKCLYNYYFFGDIYGAIFIYSIDKAKEDENEEEDSNEDNEKLEIFGSFEIVNIEDKNNIINEISFKAKNLRKEYYNTKDKGRLIPVIKSNKSIFNFEVKIIKTLYNHTKEIKYIDFNPRLNIFLSYSLDKFINIYIFPKCKLINVIDTSQFKEKKFFEEVVLLSYPFPMIVCHNSECIYLLSINGEIIKKEDLEEGHKISFSVDKNLGLSQDLVIIEDSKGERNFNFM